MLRAPDGAADDQDGYTPQAAGTVRDGDGTTRRYTVVGWPPFGRSGSKKAAADKPEKRGGWYVLTITSAFLLLIALAAGTMYVSYEAQVAYVHSYKGQGQAVELAVHLEAIAWDAAALIFGLLGLATAMRGQSALRARIGNLVCIGVSVAMNAAPVWDGAQTGAGALLVYAGPPLLYAATSDTVILEIQNRACRDQDKSHSIWALVGALFRSVGAVFGWLLLMVLDFKRAPGAARKWYVEHWNYAPGRSAADDKAEKAEKRALEAGDMAERVKAASAEQVQALEAKAEEERAALREQHAADLQAAREEAEQRLQEQKAEYEAALEALRQRLAGVEQRAEEGLKAAEQRREADLDAQDTERRREVERLRAAVEQAEAGAEQARAEAARLGRELQVARGVLSLRQQVELMYDELGRRGDARYGSYEEIDAVAEELLARLEEGAEARTVRRYLREIVTGLAESGQHTGAAPAETRVTSASEAMIGGA
ncbi:coiled-coil domain-containing protein [Nocardiopsis baichengensis]|uniref:hypothetical protein n=1 Tax=Nocardiopsis baichengensis TaxID=280240 RepID=UPI001267D838|nr:hypothetical protein [Nocardiopsis baichengensis]